MMRKMIFVFCLFLFPIVFTYSQSEVELDCNLNLESIFKAHELEIKYETVQYIYTMKVKKRGNFPKIVLF
jgi:hypothetical protein